MQLVIPGLLDLPRRDVGEVAIYELARGATLEVRPLVPLPADLAAWGNEVIGAGLPRERIRLRVVREMTTELGWPVTAAACEIVAASGAVEELRLYIMFQFLEHGGVCVVKAADEASFAEAFATVQPLVPHVRPDFTSDVAPALALVWAGL